MKKKSIAEILQGASEQENKQARIDFLRKHDNAVLRKILQYAFDPAIVWDLPEGVPPYKPNEYLDQEGNLYSEARRLYLFVKGGNPNITPFKREMLFIAFIEGIDKEDAKVICAAKDKKIPFKWITPKLVNEAFPGLLPQIKEGE